MSLSLLNRALLRGMLAGAVVLTGTACSRSDRTESGRDNSAAVLPDTSSTPADSGTATGSVNDTATAPAQSSTSTQPTAPAQPSTSGESNTPRAETAPPSDKDAAGYRSMERDTTNTPGQYSDSARVTADTTEASSVPADTTSTEVAGAAAGYSEMARDTSTVADQADTTATPSDDVALQASTDTSSQAKADVSAEADVAVAGAADTTGNAGRIRPPEDSTEIMGQVTTDSTPGAGTPDSTEVVRIRPPEDSAEFLGDVTADAAADETADELVIRPEDRETVAASETPTDEVGAAAIGGDVTGTDAVALLSRQGTRCAVVDPEANEVVRWDMSSTPVTLNPCGMGSMVLSKVTAAGQLGSGAETQ